jgi:cell pole-organizing protein PopZ
MEGAMMNKPASKEPSMDEILSSIRQIIADDSGPAVQPSVLDAMAPAPPDPASASDAEDDFMAGLAADDLPLALSASQIVAAPEPEPEPAAEVPKVDFTGLMDEAAPADAGSESEPAFVDPEDISFVSEGDSEEPVPPPIEAVPPPVAPPRPVAMAGRERDEPAPIRPRPSTAQAAPMPDPDLSRDIAEQLLEPAAGAAVRANFAKLNNLGLGNSGLTIEAMMREMLRPMLKEWLDEHLPTVVERMVEREISRISRGVE